MHQGGSAGAIGIAIANPTDLIKIRMQADKAGTRYRGTVDAFRQIIRVRCVYIAFSFLTIAHALNPQYCVIVQSEGVAGLWTGVSPAVQRAFIVNAAELATYDQAKGMLVGTGYFQPTDVKTHFAASFLAGFFSALASSPVDVIKNRLMSQRMQLSSSVL